jgi:hypothetical protein
MKAALRPDEDEKENFMLRIFLTLVIFALPFHTEEPATGRSWLTCDPLYGGTQFDLKTPAPLHLMIWGPTPITLHQPIPVFVLDCPPKTACDLAPNTKATMTIESHDKYRWAGSYDVTRDGIKQAGQFIAVVGKQKEPVICL